MAQGIQNFAKLSDALRAGYSVYDRYENGYKVKIRTATGWAFAFAEVRTTR